MAISESELTVSLANVWKESITNLEDPSDEWLHYLRDHKEIIREHSIYIQIPAEEMVRYRYRLEDYAFEVHGIAMKQAAIVLRVINEYASNMDFDTAVTAIYIPDIGYLNELYRMYRTVQSQYNKPI